MRMARVFATMLAGVLLPGAAIAADIGPRGEIGIDAGYADLVEEKGGGAPLVAVRGGYHFTSWFELEGEAAWISPDCPEGECSDLWIALINFVFGFRPTPGVAPYLYFGFGYTDFEQDIDPGAIQLLEDPFEGQAVYQAGVGSRFFFGEKKRTGLRVEAYETFFEDDESPGAQLGIVWRLGG
jgi:hypothetical protein